MQFLQLHARDNVAVALQALEKGEKIEGANVSVVLVDDIPAGHKFALSDLQPGDTVVKYGAAIGEVVEAIRAGAHVHVHNAKTRLSGLEDYNYQPEQLLATNPDNQEFFDGYRRANGKVGTRNEIWVISTVGCVAKLAERIAAAAEARFGDACDGIVAFTHPHGCSQTGGDHENTKLISSALAQHPNAGAVLFVGLGCENNQIKDLIKEIPEDRCDRVRYFNCQQVEDELETGLECIAELVDIVRHDKRTPCPLSDLVVGMKCGGSDGFSGLSANPLVGRISDWVAAASGSVILTEVPEMFGAEQILMNRSESKDVFDSVVHLINDFKQYFIDYKQNIYENPSPGNKAGGITTLEEKSMGAIQKGGIATVTDVLQYAEPVKKKGLSLLQGPGNDAVSSTALSASGATLILFTTGRGTPLGFPAPTIKISSNTNLAESKPKWIDFNAGAVFEDGNGLDKVAEDFKKKIIDIASGRVKTRSELNQQREIAIWKNGVTL